MQKKYGLRTAYQHLLVRREISWLRGDSQLTAFTVWLWSALIHYTDSSLGQGCITLRTGEEFEKCYYGELDGLNKSFLGFFPFEISQETQWNCRDNSKYYNLCHKIIIALNICTEDYTEKPLNKHFICNKAK